MPSCPHGEVNSDNCVECQETPTKKVLVVDNGKAALTAAMEILMHQQKTQCMRPNEMTFNQFLNWWYLTGEAAPNDWSEKFEKLNDDDKLRAHLILTLMARAQGYKI